jgi:two-component system cell cycle response regulator CtrA
VSFVRVPEEPTAAAELPAISPAATVRAADCPPAPVRRLVRTGRLAVDLSARIASIDQQPLRLTRKEYAVLELLNMRKGTTLTKEMFLDHLYHGRNEPEIKIIDVFICKLRRKIARANDGKHHIETVWGRGYILRDPLPSAAE